MIVKFKKLNSTAKMPTYAKYGDAGADLVATSKSINPETNQLIFGTGLAVEIPEGHVGLIFPRSSIAKTGLALANSVGVIDSGYRGEIMFKFNILNPGIETYVVGDRIGQLVILPFPQIEYTEVNELSDSERGTGAYGSSGR